MSFSKNKLVRLTAAAAAVMVLLCAVLSFQACKGKKKEIIAPEGLTREEAALYTAVAYVCPKDDNHSKMDYLTFYIEGWSFTELPAAVKSYLEEYCAAGNARMMQFAFEDLINLGYITIGEADSFYENENVYAEGKGKIFTFTLGEGQDVASDHVAVSVKGFISDKDTSGFDVELTYRDGAWRFDEYSNSWYQHQFITEDPNGSAEPQK